MADIKQRPTHGKDVAERPTSEIVLSEATRAAFASMVMAVPDGEGAAYESILSAIMAATSWDDLNDPWDTAKSESLAGIELRIDEITRHRSDYTESLGVFLVCRGVRMDNSTPVTFAIGSVSVVAQLVKAFMLGAFPLYCTIVKADRPTERGYYPLHLQVIGSGAKAPTVGE